MLMQSIEQTGRSVDEAVEAALKVLGVSREETEVEVLAEESRGLLGILGHSEAKVRVTVKAGLAQRAVELLTRILDLMGIEGEAEIASDDAEAVHIDIHNSSDLGLLIGRRGQTLSALQLLVAVIANRSEPSENRRRVILDAEGYRGRRERALRAMARNAAERAKRTGRPVTIESLPPRERRIIHLALADDSAVATRSEGDDPHRSIIVSRRRQQRDR
jgi:spoIIIJ-associated protein